MKRTSISTRAWPAILLSLVGACSPEPRELTDRQAKAVFNQKGCNACHAVDEDRIGPSFRNVSRAYTNASAPTIERLALKIRLGGGGAWGIVPMVANPQVSDEEAKAIARWILSLPASAPTAAEQSSSVSTNPK